MLSRLRANLAKARFNRHEAAGALGDLGLFLPLLTAMAAQNGLDFAAALFFAGLFNVLTGCIYAIPMAVQPMKAIAAVALAQGLSAREIVAAGMAVSALVLLLGLTGGIDLLLRWIPRPVIRGLQLAVGLTLVMKGLEMVHKTGQWGSWNGYMIALAAALLILLLQARKFPAALLLFAAGIAIALLASPAPAAALRLGFTLPHFDLPRAADFMRAVPRAALPQLPLTLLNSVIAVAALAADLFPREKTTVRSIATSVGLMNLVGGLFGAMPMCHGAGGLAGQYRFGARSNGSILMLGAAKLLAAVLLGASLMALCAAFPVALLGVMLLFSGLELALVARDQTARDAAFIMLATAGVSLGLNNIALGTLCGLAVSALMRLQPGRKDSGI
jgi:MFS superfamily sulfate permease-like transporter